ncbi:protein MANNAN SYNTHESIS-RELATED 1-like [Amaranthus tricolor]|uniref:protein MANNAN SYNTHESIS-RELATED 1-like n=1 Tax=Amaranthus tricolor TaxID=29722 RepID=UPI00258F6B31|nr:protein MANNAN SYNTHESIS-RELATED 1-like [Amaranthus tricolor]
MQRSERDDPNDKKKYSSNWVFVFGNWISSIMVDPRQILAGFLTVTMFVMLAHMIKRDHFSSHSQVRMSSSQTTPFEGSKFAESTAVSVDSSGLWRDDAPELKPCWSKPSLEEVDRSDGYVTFSLTDGPEYHVSQIADAVVVARNLGATLVLPDIRGSKLGDKREFDDVYDAQKFISSLDGVVTVVKQPPSKISMKKIAVVKVPNRVTKDHIAEKIEPVYREKGNIRLATYFPSVNMKKSKAKSDIDSVACMAMFGTLDLQPEVRGVVDSMIERLRTLSRKSDGRFVAVDLRVDVLEKKGCKDKENSGSKSCYDAGEIASFLRKLGFGKDTTIYLTQSRWDSSLDALKELFPKTYTKEGIMPMDKKDQFLDSEAPTLEEVIDFYICSESDVFVPAISGLFYANVAGKRISSGKTEILVPSNIPGVPASPDNFISHYITKKNHLAYSCFC